MRDDPAQQAVALGDADPLYERGFPIVAKESHAAAGETAIGPRANQLSIDGGEKAIPTNTDVYAIVDSSIQSERKRQLHAFSFAAVEDHETHQTGIGKRPGFGNDELGAVVIPKIG